MEIFKGKTKVKQPKTRLADTAQVARNRLTKIPQQVTRIDAYPAVLKKGTVPVTENNVESTFKEFFREHKKLFEIEPEDLKMVSAKKVNKRWYVKYGQLYKGIPVYNATVGLDSSEDGKVNSYRGNYQPDIDVPTEPKVSLETAVETAKKTYAKKDAKKLKTKQDELIIFPDKDQDQVTYHLAWKFLLAPDEPDPELEKYFFVDAIDGTIIQSYTARFPGAHVTGTVTARIYPAVPTDTLSTVPVKNEYVDIEDAGRATTNDSGYFHKTVGWLWQLTHLHAHATSTLDGPYAHVQNSSGTDYTQTCDCNTVTPCDFVWSAADPDHINVFYHINLFHDWWQDELGLSWINHWDGTNRFNARVNYNFANAYAGDPMQFGNDPYARSSDVVYHECTHNVLCEIYGNWIGFPAAYSEAYAMDEGFADYFACSFTNDSRHGEGCSANPRDLNNTRQYPGKSSYNDEGHTGGTIIAGAAWVLRQRLAGLFGTSGARMADQLVLEAHQILSTYPRDYYFSDPHQSNLLSALYRAADTDNNLLNGFPFLNDIQQAFHAHGLLQAVLDDDDSFDFSTNTLGYLGGGDLYYTEGKFWANNVDQKGVIDLGNIANVNLATVNIPTTGYTRFGVNAVVGHTYVSKAQTGELGSYIAFQVTSISADQSKVTIRYLYRYSPTWFVANTNSLEIHKLDCGWVSRITPHHKVYCQNLQQAATLIRDSGYNGCHYCLHRYDTDTQSLEQVLQHLEEDL